MSPGGEFSKIADTGMISAHIGEFEFVCRQTFVNSACL